MKKLKIFLTYISSNRVWIITLACGRVIEANTDFYRYPICHLPSAGA